MGEAITLDGPRPLAARVVGTAPFTEVAILKNNQVIYQTGTGAREVQVAITDQTDLKSGDFYYVRVVQNNGDLAWSSPIWVD